MTDPRVGFEVDRESHIARITLRRTDRRNAIDTAMATAITEALDVVENDDDVKVVVIGGEGGHLSSGWDVDEAWSMYRDAPGGSLRKHPSQRARLTAIADLWWGPRGLYSRVLKCRKVTILEATGDCYETGLYLALCCDLVVASQDARFACPRWRNVGADGDMSLLIAEVGLKRANDLLFLGKAWSAEEALQFGLIDWVGSREAMTAKSGEYAGMCASIMRDGIVSEKYAVFASLAKMGVDLSFAATTVVAASLSNIHFQPGETNFLREMRHQGRDSALETSRRDLVGN
jgi:enoyl-CoA hydratase/carnithine racemase